MRNFLNLLLLFLQVFLALLGSVLINYYRQLEVDLYSIFFYIFVVFLVITIPLIILLLSKKVKSVYIRKSSFYIFQLLCIYNLIWLIWTIYHIIIVNYQIDYLFGLVYFLFPIFGLIGTILLFIIFGLYFFIKNK